MNDLYGATGGIRLADQDMQQQAMNQIAAMHTLGQVAMQPAQARLINANASEAEQKVDNERRLGEAMRMQGAPTGMGGGGLAGRFFDLANNAMSMGLPTQAGNMAKVANTISQGETARIATQARATRDQLTAQHQQLQLFEGLTRGVQDEAGWQAANALFSRQTGMPSPYANEPYSPETLEKVRDSVLTLKDKVHNDLLENENASKAVYRDARMSALDANKQLQERRAALAEQREERLAKTGGKPVGAPTKLEKQAATTLITGNLFPGRDMSKSNAFSPEEMDSIALGSLDLVSKAKQKVTANRGLDFQTALAQVFDESKKSGAWEPIKKQYFWQKEGAKFLGDSGTATAPLIVPKAANELQKGKYYQSPNGQIGLWNGTKFVLGTAPTPVRAAAASTPVEPADSEEEEDDE